MKEKLAKIRKAMEAELEAFESVMDVSRFRELQKELETLVTTDKVTGLLNRWKFEERLEREIDRANGSDDTFSIIMIDLDNFKDFNDANGHIAGDSLLWQVASILKEGRSDRDIVARWGGDEFIILCPYLNVHHAYLEAMTIIKHWNWNLSDVTPSIGVTEFRYGDNSESLIDRADEAMYKSKAEGKNKVEVNDV